MKRSIILLVAITIIAFLFTGLSGEASAEKTGTCCQKFQVVSPNAPLSGCIISIQWPEYPLQCTADANGQCQICNIPTGNTYTVEANCDGKRHGSTTFTACTDRYVTIYVP